MIALGGGFYNWFYFFFSLILFIGHWIKIIFKMNKEYNQTVWSITGWGLLHSCKPPKLSKSKSYKIQKNQDHR